MKTETATKIKSFLQSTGAIASAIAGVSMGILAIIRVFYPDPKPITTPTQSTGVTELK